MQVLKSEKYLNGSKKALILFHGWTCAPYIWREIATSLKDYDVFVPILPGHGCNDKKDFINSTAKDWMICAEDAYKEVLNLNYDSISLGGISMGAILATALASIVKCDKLLLVSPAFKNRDWLINLTPLMSLFMESMKGADFDLADSSLLTQEEKDNQVMYRTNVFLKPAKELLNLQCAENKKILTAKFNEALIIYSQEDKAVGFDSVAYVTGELMKTENWQNLRLELMTSGEHEMILFNDREKTVNLILEFFKN